MSQRPRFQPRFRPHTAALVFFLLFGIGIPWWWRFLPETGVALVWGAPVWFITSVAASLIVSLTAVRYLDQAWSSLDEDEDEHE